MVAIATGWKLVRHLTDLLLLWLFFGTERWTERLWSEERHLIIPFSCNQNMGPCIQMKYQICFLSFSLLLFLVKGLFSESKIIMMFSVVHDWHMCLEAAQNPWMDFALHFCHGCFPLCIFLQLNVPLICYERTCCEPPPSSVIFFSWLPSLWKVSVTVCWIRWSNNLLQMQSNPDVYINCINGQWPVFL